MKKRVEMMKRGKAKLFAALTVMALLIQCVMPCLVSYAESDITLTFSEDGISETVSGSGYTIEATTLTIEETGTYRITGSSSEGNIEVKKGTTDVVLILDNLYLRSSQTAPLIVKKDGAEVTLQLEGSSTLISAEDPANETSEDTTIADSFEGAAIKVKSVSSLTVCGSGILNIDSTACKNGIKGSAEATVTVNSGIINVNAANSGIASDGALVINGGTFNITSGKDALKSEPDLEDTVSAGSVAINGGEFVINAQGDAIHAANSVLITDGKFQIQTLDGYNSTSFDSDTMSCKGIKASSDVEDAECLLTITGGTFYINTADDAIHSDAYATVTGGTFEIYTGDDAFHADTSLILGSDSGLERDPNVTVYASYEGLEGGTVYIHSGKYYVTSSDDGINAAGGSDSTDTGTGDNFRPGGNRPGGTTSNPGTTTSGSYAIYIYGGTLYVNADGDGLDSNGNIYIYGGEMEIWGMRSGGDNEPIDKDGSLTIQDATVFAAGSAGMGAVHNSISSTNQSYKYSQSSISSGKTLYINDQSGNTEYYAVAPKNVSYVFYTSPSITSSYSISSTGTASCSAGNAWTHTWDDGAVTLEPTKEAVGVMTYTCTACALTECQTIPMLLTVEADSGGDGEGDGEDSGELTEGYVAVFSGDSGVVSFDAYYTQDYTAADEVDVTSAYARNSSTGEIDISGDGQINFLVKVKDGYALDAVTVSGSYKNLKDDADTGVANLYRITKVSGNLTVAVTTVKLEAAKATVVFDGVAAEYEVGTELTLGASEYVYEGGNIYVLIGFAVDGETVENGYVLTVADGGHTVETLRYMYGDINNDGRVNMLDSFILKRISAGYEDEYDADRADIYENGSINAKDLLKLKRIIAGMEQII